MLYGGWVCWFALEYAPTEAAACAARFDCCSTIDGFPGLIYL